MEENRFSGAFNFAKGAVKSGTKVVSSATASLMIKTTYNSLALSNKAMVMMDLEKGDKIRMYDMKQQGANDQNSRFYISKAFEEKGIVSGATIGDNNAFSYSTIYSGLLANDFDIESLTTKELVSRDLMEARVGNKKDGGTYMTYVALKKGAGELVPFNDGEPVEVADNVLIPIFAITNIELVEHTPKGGDTKVKAEVEAKVEEADAITNEEF